MIIAEASIRLPAVYVSHLFGDPRKPRVVTVRLGLLTVIWMGRQARNALMEAARGITNDPDWWAKNHPTIRAARNDAERRAWRSQRRMVEAHRAAMHKEIAEQSDEIGRLRNENRTLRDAFKLIDGQGERK